MINSVLFLFNISDTLGRMTPNFIVMPRKLAEKIVFIRILFIPMIGLLDSLQQFDMISVSALTLTRKVNFTSTCNLIITILLGFSHGYLTSICYYYAPTLVDDDYKDRAGSSIVFFLIAGLFVGTLISLSCISKIIS